MSTPPLDPKWVDRTGHVLWVQHCAEAPVPLPAVDAMRRFLDKEQRPQELSTEEWLGLPARTRQAAALLLHARAEDLSFSGSTSGALTAVAQTLRWYPGDEVLTARGEYPANAWPWKALAPRGVTLREVPLWEGHCAGAQALDTRPPSAGVDPETRLLDALGKRTRVLAVSWVRFQDGLRLDLRRLAQGCGSRGVALVVDGIQGAGTLPLDLAGVQAFATGVHKGLMAPQGVGLLVTEQTFRDQLAPLGSWLSVQDASNWARPATDLARDWLPDGRKLEPGAPGGVLLSGLEVSLTLLHQAGPAAIAAHVHRLQGLLLDRLVGIPAWAANAARLQGLRDAGRLGSILGFHHGGRGAGWLMDVFRAGLDQHIHASVREGYLRVALHGWHTEEDVDRLAGWLAAA